jgi:hypothetical protein
VIRNSGLRLTEDTGNQGRARAPTLQMSAGSNAISPSFKDEKSVFSAMQWGFEGSRVHEKEKQDE